METKKLINPNAFPTPMETGYEYNDKGERTDTQEGMTLRDYFAAKSLGNLLPENPTGCYGGYSIGVNDIKAIAEMSYLIADAMLKVREETDL
jgi:hypothetical protein